jgi:carbon storage regulator
MLVLSRKIGEKIIVDQQTTIIVLRVSVNRVKLGVVAPRNVSINREEIERKANFEMSQQ